MQLAQKLCSGLFDLLSLFFFMSKVKDYAWGWNAAWK